MAHAEPDTSSRPSLNRRRCGWLKYTLWQHGYKLTKVCICLHIIQLKCYAARTSRANVSRRCFERLVSVSASYVSDCWSVMTEYIYIEEAGSSGRAWPIYSNQRLVSYIMVNDTIISFIIIIADAARQSSSQLFPTNELLQLLDDSMHSTNVCRQPPSNEGSCNALQPEMSYDRCSLMTYVATNELQLMPVTVIRMKKTISDRAVQIIIR